MLTTSLLFLFTCLCLNDPPALTRVDDEIALEYTANFAASRLPWDKFLCTANISVLSQDLDDATGAMDTAFSEIELRTAISFKKNWVRCEKHVLDSLVPIQNMRKLRNDTVNCFQLRTDWMGQAASNFVDLNKLPSNERSKVRSPSFLDPYHMLYQTLDVNNTYGNEVHSSRVEESQLTNMDLVVATFEEDKTGRIVIRTFISGPKVATEVIYDPKLGKMPVFIGTYGPCSREEVIAPELLSGKRSLSIERKVEWKRYRDDLWLPTRIVGEYLQYRPKTKILVIKKSFEVDITNWWAGDEVPDEVFTFEDLAVSEIGHSKVQKLIEERMTKKPMSK